ncbi:MAG: histidine phosphatase family protein [Planctomycetes bacterium]|nr:histidine phosphatase family protein [Planctomycetota bacterium]
MNPVRPLTLYLIRHGEVALDGPERVYGDMEMPLSPLGIEQLEAVGRRLADIPLDLVASSDLERAKIGAESIARWQVSAPRRVVDPGFREIFRGQWRGLTWPEIEARWPGGAQEFLEKPAEYRGHDGETVADVGSRAVQALGRLWAKVPTGGSVAVVAHSWTIRALLTAALDLPWNAVMQLPVDHAGVAVLGFVPESADGSGHWTLSSLRQAPCMKHRNRSLGDGAKPSG